jgi:hypothetical protein
MLLISVNPAFQISSPQVIISNHHIYGCPHLHILYWDFPLDIPSVATEFILNCNRAFDTDLEEFLYQVDLFASEYFRPRFTLQRSPPSCPPTLRIHLLSLTPSRPLFL